MLWDRKGVFKDKKQKRYGSPTIQKYSSSHCGFLEFKNQESTRFQCVGVGDMLRVKAETTDNDVCDLGGSPGPVSPKNHQLQSPLSSQRKNANSLNTFRSSIVELLHSDKPSSIDSGQVGFTSMTKLQIWKNVISQVLEQTETEICSLENELEPLQSESGDGMPCHNAKSHDKEIGDYDKVTRRPE
ncbi:hypothetical protein JHK87_047634 [Glycine soja]|nr:hypothetical protein JHK87_047634 [Glycine soja]